MSKKATLTFKAAVAASPIFSSDTAPDDARQKYGLSRLIEMGSNESPMGPSPLAVEAIRQAAARLNRYPPMGDELLRQALADTIGLTPDNFCTANGGSEVLEMIAAAFLNPGDECIICRPTFPVYEITARRAGARVQYVDLETKSFAYNIEPILAAISPQTKIIYLCSPNNPTGNIFSDGQMNTLLDKIPPHVLIVTDEVYHHFVTAADFPDSLEYVKAGQNVVIIHSFSKAYGLAGLRLGYAIAPAEMARYLARARQPFHLPAVTVEGGLAALRDTGHVQKTKEVVIAGRKWLFEQLTALGLQTWPSQGNFVLFKPPFAAEAVSEQLLRHGLLVRPMTQFYLPTHLRVTVGLPQENETFINALRSGLAQLESEDAPKTTTPANATAEFKF